MEQCENNSELQNQLIQEEGAPGEITSQKKQKSKKVDVFNDSIPITTLRMSTPVLISQILGFAYMIVDTFFISLINRNSSSILSGAGLIFPIYMIFYTFSRSIFLGMSSVTARAIGQKDKEAINKVGDSGMLLSILTCGIMLLISLIFGENIIKLLAGSMITQETIGYANQYFYSMLPGMIMLLLFNALSGILQGEGQAKLFGIASSLSTIINIILNPILIFGFKLGVRGSGYASSIAILFTLLFIMTMFIKKKTTVQITFNIKHMSKKLIYEVLYIGVPASIGMLFINLSSMILNNAVGTISQDAMNSWVLVNRIDQLFLIPAYAIGLTTIPMIGQNYGRGNIERCKKIFNVNVAMCLIVGAVIGLIYALLAPFIFSAFSNLPTVVSGCVTQVRLLMVATIALSAITVIGCSFQATGRPMPNLINNTIRALIASLPLAFPLFNIHIGNMYPIYICVGLGNLLTFTIAFSWAKSHFNRLKVKSEGNKISENKVKA